jgi:hypothetical protein
MTAGKLQVAPVTSPDWNTLLPLIASAFTTEATNRLPPGALRWACPYVVGNL